MDWDKLRIFHAVADAGSLTRAGAALRLSQSAVSRQISALEDTLQVTLFHRHARGLILTEQGELLFDATNAVYRRLEVAWARLRDSSEEVFGDLRVTTTIGFGSLWLAPRLAHLFAEYPQLKIDLNLEERVLDLPMREADVAIRMKEPSQPDLVRKRIMSVRMKLYATQAYVNTHGAPRTVTELGTHRLISQSPGAPQASAGRQLVERLLTMSIRSRLSVNNYYGVLQAVNHHLGIGVLPDYVTDDFPMLCNVLPDIQSNEVPVYIAFPEELRRSRRVRAFIDFVEQEVIEHRRARKAARQG